MKKSVALFLFAMLLIPATAQTSITVLDSVVFHDGYAKYVPDSTLEVGVQKLRNDLFSKKLTSKELALVGTSLQLRVVIKALCDNYDRLCSVNMALVPRGLATYHPDSVQHLELGRFITPFMSKNVLPDTVEYAFEIDNVASLMKDKSLTKTYDIWLELEVFGIPYAAQKQVAGCSERNDVFQGKLELITNEPAPKQQGNFLMPLCFKQAFNNYSKEGTDTIGLTTKQITFSLSRRLTNAAIYLITSNHGANEGGEEYIRREHLVYVDGVQKLTYKPGRLSCEPFRKNNTQRNGIYGKEPKSEEEWQSFSNWCPGDVIDIHRIELGAISAGRHTFLIQVPSAEFVGKQGNFPLSLYLQGSY